MDEGIGETWPQPPDRYVLIADDDPEFCSQVASIARQRGYDCVVQPSAADCLSFLRAIRGRQSPPFVLLLDLQMEDAEAGFRALTSIKRSRGKVRTIPTIILSGTKDNSDVCKSYRIGASAFIRKYLDSARNVKSVSAILDFWSYDAVKLCS